MSMGVRVDWSSVERGRVSRGSTEDSEHIINKNKIPDHTFDVYVYKVLNVRL